MKKLIIALIIISLILITCCISTSVFLYFQSKKVNFSGNDALIEAGNSTIFINKEKFDPDELKDIKVVVASNASEKEDYKFSKIDFEITEDNEKYIKLELEAPQNPDCLIIYIQNKPVKPMVTTSWLPQPSDSWVCSNFDFSKNFDEL